MEKVFQNFMGKKISQEQIDAVAKEHYKEFASKPIPGGFEVTLAKMDIGLLDGKKKHLFIISKMPDEELLDANFGIHKNVTFISKSGTLKAVGTYAMLEGRKFFCANEEQDSKPTKPAKPAK